MLVGDAVPPPDPFFGASRDEGEWGAQATLGRASRLEGTS